MQGYVAEVDGMTTKLQFHFFYIKNCSLRLDILIASKTQGMRLGGFTPCLATVVDYG